MIIYNFVKYIANRLIIWRSQVQALAGPRFYYSDLRAFVGRCFSFLRKPLINTGMKLIMNCVCDFICGKSVNIAKNSVYILYCTTALMSICSTVLGPLKYEILSTPSNMTRTETAVLDLRSPVLCRQSKSQSYLCMLLV